MNFYTTTPTPAPASAPQPVAIEPVEPVVSEAPVFEESQVAATRIKVLGVGGGGCNAINSMINANVRGVDYIAVNTDYPVLASNSASHKITIGAKLTRGQGAGSDPHVGKAAAEESIAEIEKALENVEMLFIISGMGGGTGTGAAPVIARVAKNLKILTVAIVTLPFSFEGPKRKQIAMEGIEELRAEVDALIVVPNDRMRMVNKKMSLQNAFALADNILMCGVKCISELINVQGHINLDFADVSTILKDSGVAHMGIGTATGENRASDAARAAMDSPMLATSMAGAKRLLVNITASSDIGLEEVEIASTLICEGTEPDARIIWGVVFDESMGENLSITVVATGFEPDELDNSSNHTAINRSYSDISEMIGTPRTEG